MLKTIRSALAVQSGHHVVSLLADIPTVHKDSAAQGSDGLEAEISLLFFLGHDGIWVVVSLGRQDGEAVENPVLSDCKSK